MMPFFAFASVLVFFVFLLVANFVFYVSLLAHVCVFLPLTNNSCDVVAGVRTFACVSIRNDSRAA